LTMGLILHFKCQPAFHENILSKHFRGNVNFVRPRAFRACEIEKTEGSVETKEQVKYTYILWSRLF